jgi:hypothetical protein
MDRHNLATYPAPSTLRAMLGAAESFGLTPDEAWRTLDAALIGPSFEATAAGSLDEIAGALAQQILAKQRRILGDQAS